MSVPVRVLLLPGLWNSGPEHWQSRWERTDPSCVRVVQQDWVTPARADWVATLEAAVAASGPDVVLVAHSTACALVAFWAAATSRTVRGALLVAPSDTEASSYPGGPTGWQPMPLAALPFPSIVVASSDDEFATLDRARAFAEAWGSRFVHIGAAGHINAASGLGPWSRGMELLAELLNEQSAGEGDGCVSEYRTVVMWSRDGAAFTDNRYSRSHRWLFDGGVEVPASSSPKVVPLPLSVAAAVDPEEAFVVSLSSCHMLAFLFIAAKRGFLVDSYRDEAVGVLAMDSSGKLAMTRVTLRPEAHFTGDKGPTADEVVAMHHESHEQCFIASSVKTDVRCEPVGPRHTP